MSRAPRTGAAPAPPSPPPTPRATSDVVASAAGHRGDHRSLVGPGAPAPVDRPPADHVDGTPVVDVVVVPAYRPVDSLHEAFAVARDAGARLLVLCSGHVTAEAVVGLAARLGSDVPVDALDTTGYRDGWLSFAVDDHPEATALRRHDANGKRNLALLLARLVGWRRVLLLNDDVRGLTAERLRSTRAALDAVVADDDESLARFAAAGWAFSRFPDNSVVCHAHGTLGGRQQQFLSDAALMLQVGRAMPFFPPVYNEDWLFLLRAVGSGRARLVGDDLRQLAFNPYAQPRRAQAEEFGDVLAEGLMNLLHDRPVDDELPWDRMVEVDYWRDVVAERSRFVLDVIARAAAWRGRDRDDMLACLRAAHRRHEPGWPDALARWVRLWRDDLDRWEKTLDACGSGQSLEDALAMLDLTSRHRAARSFRPV